MGTHCAPATPDPVCGRMLFSGNVVVQWADGSSSRIGRQQLRLLTVLYQSGNEAVALSTLTAAFWELSLGHPPGPTTRGIWQAQHVVLRLRRLVEQELVVPRGPDSCALTPRGVQLTTWLTTTWDGWPAYAVRWLHPLPHAPLIHA